MFAPELLPNRGGVGSYCVGLLRELSRTVELTVLTPQWWLGGKTLTAREIEAYFEDRLRVETISEARDSFLYNPRFQWAVLRRLRRLVRQERFDAYHSHHAHMPDVLSRPLNPSCRTIRTVHSTIGGQRDAIRAAQGLGGGLAAVDRWQVLLEPALLRSERALLSRHEDYFLGVSRWGGAQLARIGVPPHRIGLAQCGVDPTIFGPATPASGRSIERDPNPTVIFPGRPTMIRGGGVLAEAIPHVLQAVPDARFVVTGGTMEDLPGLARLSPSERHHLRCTGHLPYDRVPDVYRGADVAVVPTYYDNLPIRVLEAMATGLPVVASSVGGIPEVVRPGETGVLVPPGESRPLADALIRLLREPREARRMGKRAEELVRSEYSWKSTAEATRTAYEKAWA